MCGTPLNMAPEVLVGNLYDLKADVWSLGTVLFQMLTGEYPFEGRDMDDLKQNHAQGVYKVPSHIKVSASCLDFLNSCLRFESEKRKSWDELLEHPFMLTSTFSNGGTCVQQSPL